MHFGVLTPPVAGHIHPFGALSRELISRGHRVSFVHVADLADRIRAEEAEFIPVGHADFPPGALRASLAALGARKGLSALRFTIGEIAKTTDMMLREAPAAIREAGISMILGDQTEPAAATIAERLDIPFVTICNALLLNREEHVPPPFTPWDYKPNWAAVLRNQIGYYASDRMTKPIADVVAKYRSSWGLRPHRSPEDSFSPLAQISQQPRSFDFPRRRLPDSFHYAGPLRRPYSRKVPFPWERLNGKPLVYASLGTLQNNRPDVFRLFAESCVNSGAQLVLAHGGGLSADQEKSLPEDVIAVSYAPQIEVLARASLTITHAGLNTVLDSLTFGVPLIAIPITYEQPAIARRVTWTRAGQTIPFNRLTAAALREKMARSFAPDSPYRASAARVAEDIRASGGVTTAANIILSVA